MDFTNLDAVCDPLTVTKYARKASLKLSEARKTLEEYVKKNGSDQLWALYEISGIANPADVPFITDKSDVRKNLIVPEKDLEVAKSKFKSVISTQLYSIQRTNPKETRVYGRQWDNDDDLVGKNLNIDPPKKIIKQEVVKEKTPEPKTEKKKQTGLMTMFTTKPKQEAKKATPEKVIVPKKEKSESPVIRKKRPKIEIDEDDLFDQADDQPEVEQPEKEESEPVEPPAKRKKALNEENQTKSKKMAAKKPLIIDDSEKEMAVEEENSPKKVLPKKTPSGERKKTTKSEKVVETFIDEDGFLVSKEVNKTIECSPEKSPEKPKPKITAPPPGQVKTAKKNASIMSFFKKA